MHLSLEDLHQIAARMLAHYWEGTRDHNVSQTQELPRILRQLHMTLKANGVLFSSNPRGNGQEAAETAL